MLDPIIPRVDSVNSPFKRVTNPDPVFRMDLFSGPDPADNKKLKIIKKKYARSISITNL